METLIKTSEFGAREAIEGHGIDYSVLMQARTYKDATFRNQTHIERKQVLCWDTIEIRQILSQIAAANKEDAFSLR